MRNIFKTFLSLGALSLLTCNIFANPTDSKTRGMPSGNNTAQALSIVEAVQTTFRSISNTLLPSVVEIDVTETKTYQDPFQGLGWPFGDFFGNRNGDGGTKEYESKGLGSGVIVKRTGNTLYVLTNNHVAGSATKISVKLNDGRIFDAKLVGADARIDIALVSFEANDKSIPVAALGDSDKVMPGDLCMAFGAPLGYAQSVTQGIVSATGRSDLHMSSISDYIQTDTAINQGNSGGPLVNIYGEVIGINTWIASQSGGSQGLGFAIPINNVKKAIDSFIKSGKIAYGWLGVTIVDLTEDYKKDLEISNMDGAFVEDVFSSSPAFKYGIKPGDFIFEINGRPIKNSNQLIRDISGIEAGTSAKFSIIRGGKRITDISVKLDERSSDIETQNSKMFLGFLANPLTDSAKEKLKITDKKLKGVYVSGVREKSPAAALRLQNGDVITAVNGKSVKTLSEFYNEVAQAQKSINFDVYNNGVTITTGTFKIQ